MKPGDFIEWVYKSDNVVVPHDEMLWSTLMQKWVPIGGLNLLVALTGDTMVWLNNKGLFHASADDAESDTAPSGAYRIVPRQRG
jgi:hypothetical protein